MSISFSRIKLLAALMILTLPYSCSEHLSRVNITRIQNTLTFSEGLVAFAENGKWGFMNKKGEIVIRPQFKQVWHFNQGLAPFMLTKKWGFIDRAGKIVIMPKFNDIKGYTEGLSAVKIDDKWGYINKQGRFIIPAQFDDVMPFSNGTAAIRVGTNWGFIDKNGKIIINPIYKQTGVFKMGLAPVAKNRSNDAWGYINPKGQVVIPFSFDYALQFDEGTGLAPVNVDEKWGYINLKGKFVINPEYSYARPFYRGRAAVFKNKKWGFIDSAGKIVIPIAYDQADNFHDEMVHVVRGEKSYFINLEGRSTGTIAFTQPSRASLPGYSKSLHIKNDAAYHTLTFIIFQSAGEDGKYELKPGEERTFRPAEGSSVGYRDVNYIGLRPQGVYSIKKEYQTYPITEYVRFWLLRKWIIINKTAFHVEGAVIAKDKKWGAQFIAYANASNEREMPPDIADGYEMVALSVWNPPDPEGRKFTVQEYRVVDPEKAILEISKVEVINLPIDEVTIEIYGGYNTVWPIPYIVVYVEDIQTGTKESWSVWGGSHRSRHVTQRIGYKGIKSYYFMVEGDENHRYDVYKITGGRTNYTIYPQGTGSVR